MKSLKLMADYHCHPLWDMSFGGYGDIDPCELPISKKLQIRLAKWAATYDETLDAEYPPNSGFKSDELEREFKLEGERLAASLMSELGPGISVLFKF